MNESLEIRNFGPLVDVVISHIRPLTVFVGESGSGKSTIIKVLSLFRWYYKMICIRSYLHQAGISRSPFSFNFKYSLKASGLDSFLKSDTDIIYRNGSTEIAVIGGKLGNVQDVPAEEISIEKNCFISDKRNMIPDLLAAKIDKSDIGFYLKETYEDFKAASSEIKTIPIEYLGVKMSVENTNGKEKIKISGLNENDYSIGWEDASSGMQTVSPLTMIVEYYASRYNIENVFNNAILKYLVGSDDLKNFSPKYNVGDIKRKRVNIHIEEPELSLYPESQKHLLDYLINKCLMEKAGHGEITLMIATHSPYIVNYINLLVKRNLSEQGRAYPHISFENVDVYEVSEGMISSLKIGDGHDLIDTRLMSDPISGIYEEYNSLK